MAFNNLYDPKTFDELVFADSNTADALRLVAEGKIYHHIILHGPYGTGKSQAARVIARDNLGGDKSAKLIVVEPDQDPNEAVAELKAAYGNSFWQMFGGTNRPYAVVNEIDRYPGLSQVRIRGTMDAMDSMKSGKLIMTTNNLHKVDGGIRDRCMCHEILMPSAEQCLPLLQRICREENIVPNDHVLLGLLTHAPSLRRATDNLELAINQYRIRSAA